MSSLFLKVWAVLLYAFQVQVRANARPNMHGPARDTGCQPAGSGCTRRMPSPRGAAGAVNCCLRRTSATTALKAEGKFLGNVSPQMAEVFLNRNTEAEDRAGLGLCHSLVSGLDQAPQLCPLSNGSNMGCHSGWW